MSTAVIDISTRQGAPPEPDQQLRQLVVGQENALDAIVPYVQLFESGLAPLGRPLGVFLLMGPTGTGKTRTAESLAQVLHGSEKSVLRVDCGEFQLEHEVAKLVGAPPGYLGHRETQPLISQHKLNAVTSERSQISIVLFDEVEKAAPALQRLLLGVLDKASLKLGDNTFVNFERSLIFLTTNAGANEMTRHLAHRFGLAACGEADGERSDRLHRIGMTALRKRFSPEFLNRIDHTLTYGPLSEEALNRILDLQLEALNAHVARQLAARSFSVRLTEGARRFLLRKGTSERYGARELKRTIHKFLIQPLAGLVVQKKTEAGVTLEADAREAEEGLVLRVCGSR